MRHLLNCAVMASLLVGASSCSDTFDATSDQQGRLVLDLNVSHDVAAPANAPKGAPARGDSRAPEYNIQLQSHFLKAKPNRLPLLKTQLNQKHFRNY